MNILKQGGIFMFELDPDVREIFNAIYDKVRRTENISESEFLNRVLRSWLEPCFSYILLTFLVK
jgi:hypothetical protein